MSPLKLLKWAAAGAVFATALTTAYYPAKAAPAKPVAIYQGCFDADAALDVALQPDEVYEQAFIAYVELGACVMFADKVEADCDAEPIELWAEDFVIVRLRLNDGTLIFSWSDPRTEKADWSCSSQHARKGA